MNKKSIITILLALVAMAGQGQKQVVWEKPAAFMGAYNSTFEITKVELKQTETVLHIVANYRPNVWIRFAKESFVQTPDGKKYAITDGKKTNEQESDLQLDSLFWMPESGKANLALHFKPVPLDTKEMDFSEGDVDGAFRFWNICDGKTKQKLVLPDDWKSVKYAKDETLPVAKINKGVATINVKMLGYKPGMKLEFYVGGFKPLGSTESFSKFFPFADDGTLKVEIPLWLVREVTVGVQGLAYSNIIIAPGQETDILMKITSDKKPFVAFKGYLGKTNKDLEAAYDEDYGDDTTVFLKVRECQTKEERLMCLTDIFDKRIAAFMKTKYTTATKDLLCMTAEADYIEWTRQFANTYCQYKVDEDGTVYMTNENYEENYKKCIDMLPLSADELAYNWKFLNEPGSPCSSAFWQVVLDAYDKKAQEKNAYNSILRAIPLLLESENVKEEDIKNLPFEDCKAVILDYRAEQQRVALQLASQENVFYKKYDNVTPEDILHTILDKYKGKAVLIDIWATWCGPCRAGHKAMAPMKEQMKSQNVQFVYITSPSSPLSTWQEMIKDIDGDHYYLTNEQYGYILQKYESEGIPTYAIYNAKGEQTYKSIGFPGPDTIKNEIEKAQK